MAKIKKFWVVTQPTKNSTMIDILFPSTINLMGFQFIGGLQPYEVIGIYTTKKEAESIAKKLLTTINQ